VADAVRKFPDVFIGFGSVDPWKGKLAIAELDRAVTALGLRGLKLHPIVQAFWPNDRRFYPLWDACVGLGIPVMFHTGTTGVGAGVPGGNGLRLKYGNPMPALDDLAAEFPGLTIIGAHPSFPWQDEMLAIAVHKTNVYLDLSGWSPKYFSPTLVQYTKSLLQDRVLFGTDYPFLTPDQWLTEFDKLGFKPEVRQKILLDNARRLLRL
jgi:predicted TIM-barrel fold metal-dependent hydrolase